MKIIQITFVAKNANCVSIKPKRYLFNTTCIHDALVAAEKLIKEEKHADRYKALPALIIDVYEV